MATLRYPRFLAATLARDLDLYPVVALVGARQVGKSTLAREIADVRGLAVRTLDDRGVLTQAREDPEGLLDELRDGGVIDEAQRAPGLFLAIKAVVDREQRPGRFLLSGSNQPAVTSAVSDSLLGRSAYRTLRPLTLGELRFDEVYRGWDFLFSEDEQTALVTLERRAEDHGPLDWRDTVETGGFPRAVAAPTDLRRQLLDDYVEVFANRDVREVVAVDSSARFEEFVRLVAAWTGQVLNTQGIARDIGVSVTTVRRWLDALGRSYLLETVPAYSRNAGERVISAPKLFLVDTALALAAAGEFDATGFHLENLVATDLAVWKDSAPGRRVHHWRSARKQEIDFVLQRGRALLPVEVKTSAVVGARETTHLATFLERYPEAVRGVLVSSDPNIRVVRDRIIAAPWWSVL